MNGFNAALKSGLNFFGGFGTGIFIVSTGSAPAPNPVAPDIGTEVSWTDDTYFDSFTSQSGITVADVTGSNGLTWQLYYAHQAITIPADATNRIGVNTFSTQTAAPKPIRFVSGSNNSLISGFGGEKSLVGTNNLSSTPGGFVEQACNSATTIAAGTYFIVGIGTIFFRTLKTQTTNRTAMLNGNPVVTVLPTNWWSSQLNVQTSGFPTELGGTRTPTEKFTDKVVMLSIKFKLA